MTAFQDRLRAGSSNWHREQPSPRTQMDRNLLGDPQGQHLVKGSIEDFGMSVRKEMVISLFPSEA